MDALRSPRTRHRRAGFFVDIASLPPQGRQSRRRTGRRAGSFRRETRADPQLIRWSDCNVSPPPIALPLFLTAPVERSSLSGRASMKAAAPFQRGGAASIGEWKIGAQGQFVARKALIRHRKFQPPVTLMWRLTLGRLWRRSMMKSWPFGFRPMARSIAAESRSLSAEARSGLRKSEASS